jgi:Fe-S oxidoreductase
MQSTRGRARLLFEMLEGDPLTGGWEDEHVKAALDLCLACKGCKSECPVSVDMATYKAEFLSHYYERRRRPISAFAFGLIHYWARLASTMPGVVNLLTQTPGVSAIAKLAAGMSLKRQIPAFAPSTFVDWFRRRSGPRDAGRPRVMLWPDTFNNHFHPETAIAAVHVLERAGFAVIVPTEPLCCGRPLYDYGMLDTAAAWLKQTLTALGPAIEQGVPIVGLEPSCVAVFRDEMGELLPGDEQAKRMGRQVFLLSEFLDAHGFRYPPLHRTALVHGHCHHKAIMKFDAEDRALTAMGLDVDVLDSGCCGMAGSFGFERGHYDISMTVGERVLLPAVRRARKDTLIVADGFSCRTQIAQSTDRRALHLADVLEMAARDGRRGPSGDYPERNYVPSREHRGRLPATPLVVGGLIAAAGVAYALARGRR